MKNKTLNTIRISKKHPILLAYAVVNLVLLIMNQIGNLRTGYKAEHMISSQYSTSQAAANVGIILAS